MRFKAEDQPGVLSKISGILSEYEISIFAVMQKGRKENDYVPIVMLTYEASEENLKQGESGDRPPWPSQGARACIYASKRTSYEARRRQRLSWFAMHLMAKGCAVNESTSQRINASTVLKLPNSSPGGTMKYIVVIGDGMADFPMDELGGKTPLMAARRSRTWNDGVAGILRAGGHGSTGFSPGSDVACMSIFGYDPAKYYTGQGANRGLRHGHRHGMRRMSPSGATWSTWMCAAA